MIGWQARAGGIPAGTDLLLHATGNLPPQSDPFVTEHRMNRRVIRRPRQNHGFVIQDRPRLCDFGVDDSRERR